MKKLIVLTIAAVAVLVPLYSQANAGEPTNCDGGVADFTITDGAGEFTMAVGTSGDDVFAPFGTGHEGPFIVFGLEGNDTICGSNSGDVIYGGPGNDILGGHGGDDVIHGGPGNDFIDGHLGVDRLFGGDGDDWIKHQKIDFVDEGSDSTLSSPPLAAAPAPTAVEEAEPTATPRPTRRPRQNGSPRPRSTPRAIPTVTPTPTPTPTVEPTPTSGPTPTPTPTSTVVPTPPPPPSNPSLPQTYGENLSLIQGASASADQRRAIVWDTGQRLDFPLNEGNPFRYTPSAQLDYNDFVYHQGSQYGPDKGRGPTGGVFHATCQFSHLAYDDPIVFPGQPGRSHLHMFFGNTHANAFSTSSSILNEGGSTCSRGELNRTSYWIPAAIDGNDNVLVPDQFMVYYESYDQEWDTLVPFPAGLKMVQGQAMATSVQPNIPNYGTPSVRWKCGWYTTARLGGGGSAGPFTATPTNCSDSQYSHVELQIKWPFCWDGQNLDSANHKDHVVFPQAGPGYFVPGTCPGSHPVTLPRITYRVHFKTQTITSPTSDILLSSDIQPADGTLSPNGVSGHGDWFGGWNRDLLQGLVDRCILTGEECDEQHYGTPDGDQAAATRIESRVITPQEVVEYCPLRNQYDGNLYNVAYCRE